MTDHRGEKPQIWLVLLLSYFKCHIVIARFIVNHHSHTCDWYNIEKWELCRICTDKHLTLLCIHFLLVTGIDIWAAVFLVLGISILYTVMVSLIWRVEGGISVHKKMKIMHLSKVNL